MEAVVIDGPTSWNFVDKTWNEGFFKEVGDKADFYVIHNYFGFTYTPKYLLNVAVSEPKKKLIISSRIFKNIMHLQNQLL